MWRCPCTVVVCKVVTGLLGMLELYRHGLAAAAAAAAAQGLLTSLQLGSGSWGRIRLVLYMRSCS
jgi:hypothetical protein